MSRIIQLGFLLFLAVAFSNCKKDDSNPSVIINVEDDFYIDIFEDISNGEKVFIITIKSIQNQDCQNSIIDYTLDIIEEENQIILSINDILEPETCIPGSAPAVVAIPIENIKEQDYFIQINLKDVIINKGTLIVNGNYYYMRMNTENGFELTNKKLNRIPGKTIWGYVGYDEESYKMEAENFIKDLGNISTDINFVEGYDIGYFGYFTILEDRSVLLNQEVADKFLSTFIYYFDANSQLIIDLIDSYCNSNPEINFHVFNDEGQEMKCQ